MRGGDREKERRKLKEKQKGPITVLRNTTTTQRYEFFSPNYRLTCGVNCEHLFARFTPRKINNKVTKNEILEILNERLSGAAAICTKFRKVPGRRFRNRSRRGRRLALSRVLEAGEKAVFFASA